MPRKSTNANPDIKRVPLADAIEDFMRALPGGGKPPTKSGDLSADTVRSKRRTLKALSEIAGGGHVIVRDLTIATMQETLNRLEDGLTPEENERRRLLGMRKVTGRSARALALDKATLTQFIEHCKDKFWMHYWMKVPKEITQSTKNTGQRRRDRRVIPREHFMDILEIADTIHPRVRMAVALNMLWARRISDVVDARWSYLTYSQGILVAKLKNIKRGRNLPDIEVDWGMQEEIRRWREWLTSRYGIPQDDWYLVPARLSAPEAYRGIAYRAALDDTRNWPINPMRKTDASNLRLDFHKVLKIYGWDDTNGEGGHTFRRSGGRAFEELYGIEAAQCLYDHESAATTFIYNQNVSGQGALEDAMRKGGLLGPQPPRQGEAEIIPFMRRKSAG